LNRLQQVTDFILLKIDTQAWSAGQQLPSERSLSLTMDISRATIREALISLKQQGVITSIPGSGHYVGQSEAIKKENQSLIFGSLDDLTHQELREYRFAIESQCAYLAASRASNDQLKGIERAHRHLKHVHLKNDLKAEGLADARFHLAIAEACGNRILAQSLKSLFSLLRANVTQNISSLSKRPETRLRLMRQHTSLFESIYYKKPEKARAIAQEHMAFVDRVLNEL